MVEKCCLFSIHAQNLKKKNCQFRTRFYSFIRTFLADFQSVSANVIHRVAWYKPFRWKQFDHIIFISYYCPTEFYYNQTKDTLLMKKICHYLEYAALICLNC